MQKIILGSCLAFFLLSCTRNNKKEFEITGILKNANSKMVYLQETPLATDQRIVVDSSKIGNDGSYHLHASRSEESLFQLFTENANYPFAYVINDAEKIKLDMDLKDPQNYSVEGSEASKAIKEFSVATSTKWAQLNRMGMEMDSLVKAKAPDSALNALNENGKKALGELKEYIKLFISRSSSPVMSILAFGSYPQIFSQEEYDQTLNDIVKKFPKHKGIAAVKKMSDRQMALNKQKSEEMTEPEWVGKEAPELSLPDVNGNEVKLSSLKGRYVLVDFWASWCAPCRRENPNVVQAYNKYKDKNFTILGVSLDKNKEDWIAAIKKDNLAWKHVSDLQEWSSAAVSTYHLNSIPFNVLIDPSGKIIAQGLTGTQLNLKLEEVLK